jgi:hypothetical protein
MCEVERRATGRDHHEGILRHRIGPLRGQRHQLTGGVIDVDPVGPPVLAPLDELELLAGERVERVGYADQVPISYILRIGCI